jgi:hypothetical protein
MPSRMIRNPGIDPPAAAMTCRFAAVAGDK